MKGGRESSWAAGNARRVESLRLLCWDQRQVPHPRRAPRRESKLHSSWIGEGEFLQLNRLRRGPCIRRKSLPLAEVPQVLARTNIRVKSRARKFAKMPGKSSFLVLARSLFSRSSFRCGSPFAFRLTKGLSCDLYDFYTMAEAINQSCQTR